MRGHEVMIGKKLSETAVPYPGCLPKAIERFSKTTNMMRSSDIFKVRRLDHVDLLVELTMEKRSTYVKLREVKVFNGCN
jgi:hypothetical protein